MKIINENLPQIIALCQKHKVCRLYVFGSILTDRFNENSDIDFVVNFNKAEIGDSFDNFFDFKFSLESLFGRNVDLIDDTAISNKYFRKEVDSTKYQIYGYQA